MILDGLFFGYTRACRPSLLLGARWTISGDARGRYRGTRVGRWRDLIDIDAVLEFGKVFIHCQKSGEHLAA